MKFVCQVCGYVFEGEAAPNVLNAVLQLVNSVLRLVV